MQSEPIRELEIGKFIIFSAANYSFMLPVSEVLQVINRPVTTGELDKAGLIQIGRHVIPLFDLHQQLEPENAVPAPTHRPFLVITHGLPGELCAIPVGEPPNLVEFPLDLIQILPQTGSSSGVLRVASHAATLALEQAPATVFLLNLRRMLVPIAASG